MFDDFIKTGLSSIFEDNLLIRESPWIFLFLIILGIYLVMSSKLSDYKRLRKWTLGIYLILFAFIIYFYRQPHNIPDSPNNPDNEYITSPCQGTVIDVTDMDLNKLNIGTIQNNSDENNNTYKRIACFLSPIDVHVQYAPIDGTLVQQYEKPGEFNMAFLEKSEDNEHVITKWNTSIGDIYIIQIAGFLVRRISNWTKPGDNMKRGDSFGMIKFGSRVDIIVPSKHKNKKIDIKVASGDKLIAGKSLIVEYI